MELLIRKESRRFAKPGGGRRGIRAHPEREELRIAVEARGSAAAPVNGQNQTQAHRAPAARPQAPPVSAQRSKSHFKQSDSPLRPKPEPPPAPRLRTFMESPRRRPARHTTAAPLKRPLALELAHTLTQEIPCASLL